MVRVLPWVRLQVTLLPKPEREQSRLSSSLTAWYPDGHVLPQDVRLVPQLGAQVTLGPKPEVEQERLSS